jgi:glucokinase
MILAGDIGGTKTHLALFEKDLSIKHDDIFKSRDYESLEDIITVFTQKFSDPIEVAAFGIAGPVEKGEVNTTNLSWKMSETSISSALHGVKVGLINDLEANAWGIKALKAEDFYTLQVGEIREANQALISAGTGLGEAGLYFDGNDHLPFASEGGHSDFAPLTSLQLEFYHFLSQETDHVSFERALSGKGLENIYRFLLSYKKQIQAPSMEQEMKSKDPAYVITEHALNRSDSTCIEALDLFIEIYGQEASNLALKMMALGGVYIGGGIAPKILESMKKPLFIEAFLKKGRFADLLKKVPIHVILNDQAALLGAGRYAISHLL